MHTVHISEWCLWDVTLGPVREGKQLQYAHYKKLDYTTDRGDQMSPTRIVKPDNFDIVETSLRPHEGKNIKNSKWCLSEYKQVFCKG